MGLRNMRKPKEKPLTEAELRRYERALRLWDISLQKQEQELDAREAELDSLVDEDGESIYVQESNAGSITPERLAEAFDQIGQAAMSRSWRVPKPVTFRDIEDGCKITPEEFATTIKCGPNCYAGIHAADCPVNVYLEVERLAKLEDKRP